MPKGFLIRKKITAKDLFTQAYYCQENNSACAFSIETPPPSPEEELNIVKKSKEQSMAGPSSGSLKINNSHSGMYIYR